MLNKGTRPVQVTTGVPLVAPNGTLTTVQQVPILVWMSSDYTAACCAWKLWGLSVAILWSNVPG